MPNAKNQDIVRQRVRGLIGDWPNSGNVAHTEQRRLLLDHLIRPKRGMQLHTRTVAYRFLDCCNLSRANSHFQYVLHK